MTEPTVNVSPHGKTPAEGYASAVKEIEQEKQMVAALKRLSFGHLLNTDPDVSFPENLASYEAHLDPDAEPDGAQLPPANLSRQASPEKGDVDDGDDAANTSGGSDTPIDATPFWVPANAHPEINPHQFKNHVQKTIDVLLERKLSRSKSTRSKRSSLSLSTTDFVLPESPAPPDAPPPDPPTPANPSLRVLTSELEELSRLAGMSASDAVTLARSLSTSSLGYTDAEMQAFDDMGSGPAPRASHAELLDLGTDDRTRGAPPPALASPPASGTAPRSPQPPSDDFALRRSRRLDYRKPHGGALGSQLQSRKAENLAELRSTLASSPAAASPRNSLNSINPRSSQILFSYRGPAKSAPPQTSSPRRPSPTPYAHSSPSPAPAPHQRRSSSRENAPYQERRVSPISTKSTDDFISLGSGDRHYGQRRVSPKMHPGNGSGSYQGHQTYQTQGARHGRSSPVSGHHMRPSASQTSLNGASTTKKDRQYASYPSMGPSIGGKKKHEPRESRSDTRPELRDSRPESRSDLRPDYRDSRAEARSDLRPDYRDSRAEARSDLRPEFRDARPDSRPDSRAKKADKRSKTRELNQNLDLLRTEINEFKESLSKADPVAHEQVPAPIQPLESRKPKDQKTEKPSEGHADFSFDLSSHDVSYEDSLGIEKDILEELHVEKSRTPAPNAVTPVSVSAPQPVHEKAEPKEPDVVSQNKTNWAFSPDDQALADSFEPQEFNALQDNPRNIPVEPEANLVAASAVDAVPKAVDTAIDTESETETAIETAVDTSGDTSSETPVDATAKTLVKEKSTHQTIVIPEIEDMAELSSAQSPFAPSSDVKPRAEQKLPLSERKSETNKIRTKKSFGALTKHDHTEKPEKKKGSKKGWLWSKERSVSTSDSQKSKQEGEHKVSTRAISSPELSLGKKHKNDQGGKENVISKLFKKKRSSSISSEKSHHDIVARKQNSSATVEENENEAKAKAMILRRISNKSHYPDEQKTEEMLSVKPSSSAEQKDASETAETKGADDKVKSILRNTFKKKTQESRQENADAADIPERKIPEAENKDEIPQVNEESPKPQTTQEVQEKLKKSIRRTSKPNQPIEFTDSAFGFPLPPPSQSTLVMIDHRFPVHVERAIYRLSHLKLANPKRSLREQVLLSNFMYAYLNLVDHTLHLEQQLSSEEQPLEQPEAEMELFNAEDPDTEFEIDDDLDEGTFDTIKLDLDAQENRISV